ncbi:phage tail protein [Kamptonema formosum]|uniref:phage tail protein n=1 Tax=Kamptonema formosum TaxID=331992 RepID=UPI000346A302|nr:phage tail protein [Oscillatoria sp. PCC 10802]
MPDIKPPHRPDPYSTYNFYVEWNGIIHAGFRECSGLNSTQTAGEYREGTDPLTVRKLPGLITYNNITLKRGTTNNDELWQWRSKIMKGDVERREVSIVLLDDTGKEKIRWNLTNCWPVTWSGPDFNATSNDVAVETLEFAHEGLTVDKWS